MHPRPRRALADENIPGLDDTFGRHLVLRRFTGRRLERGDLRDADVLLVRSVTPVGEDLLAGSQVRFVGTATIGTDHLDTDFLARAGIAWASAPGCNADAAAQYTLAMMLLACRRLGRPLAAQRVGIVGHGKVGSRLRRLLDTLGITTAVCDPPLVASGSLTAAGGVGLEGVPLERALGCDVVSLHVPLTDHGPWPTRGMIDDAAIGAMPRGALLVNAARGGVVRETPLRQALIDRRIHAALDVWPREPEVDGALLELCTVATPHVAGFSVEGKARGTRMIYEAFLDWIGQATGRAEAPPAAHVARRLRLALTGDPAAVIADAVFEATGVAADDERMRAETPICAERFDALRRAHAPRHEFARIAIGLPEQAAAAQEALGALGFQLEQPGVP